MSIVVGDTCANRVLAFLVEGGESDFGGFETGSGGIEAGVFDLTTVVIETGGEGEGPVCADLIIETDASVDGFEIRVFFHCSGVEAESEIVIKSIVPGGLEVDTRVAIGDIAVGK